MTDFTEGSPIERYAKVNSLILETYNQTCLDYKYKKMIDDMKKTSWEDDAAEGGILFGYNIHHNPLNYISVGHLHIGNSKSS